MSGGFQSCSIILRGRFWGRHSENVYKNGVSAPKSAPESYATALKLQRLVDIGL